MYSKIYYSCTKNNFTNLWKSTKAMSAKKSLKIIWVLKNWTILLKFVPKLKPYGSLRYGIDPIFSLCYIIYLYDTFYVGKFVLATDVPFISICNTTSVKIRGRGGVLVMGHPIHGE